MNWPEHKWTLAPLLPLAWLYRGAVALRNFFYDKNLFAVTRVPARVVSIGNPSTGGSGKTPTTAFLANALVARGVKVAIVARGYHREGIGACIVSDGQSVLAEIHEAGDEPLLLAQQCPGVPLVVDESKTRAAQIAVEHFEPQALLIDDGFQHRRLHRDLDLVIISARMMLQKPWLLPAGPLREPLSNLHRAHWILLAGLQDLSAVDQKKVFELCRSNTNAKLLPIEFCVEGIHAMFEGKKLATPQRHNASALLVSGIALPERFQKSAQSAGVIVRERLVYRDHHRYSENDVSRLIAKFQSSRVDYVLTTAKDAIKLQNFARLQSLPMYVLELRFSAVENEVNELLRAVMADETLSEKLIV